MPFGLRGDSVLRLLAAADAPALGLDVRGAADNRYSLAVEGVCVARHLAVFMILLGAGYLAVRFGGLPGSYMLAIPAIYFVYLGGYIIASRAKSWRRKS